MIGLRYMDFLENRSNQELMNRITNENETIYFRVFKGAPAKKGIHEHGNESPNRLLEPSNTVFLGCCSIGSPADIIEENFFKILQLCLD